jgi:hypothetical protein
MTKKDFQLIANIINSGVMAHPKKKQVAIKFADELSKTNNLFNRSKFLKACSVNE